MIGRCTPSSVGPGLISGGEGQATCSCTLNQDEHLIKFIMVHPYPTPLCP